MDQVRPRDDAPGSGAPTGAARFLIMLAQYAPRDPDAWTGRLARALGRALRRRGGPDSGNRPASDPGKDACPP